MQEKIKDIIFDAVDEVNEQLEKANRIEKSPDTVLFGKEGKLDSLGLVTLLVAIEQRLEDEFDTSITIADEKAMSQKRSPFYSIKTLSDYIGQLLQSASK